jgi:hypothetical protein
MPSACSRMNSIGRDNVQYAEEPTPVRNNRNADSTVLPNGRALHDNTMAGEAEAGDPSDGRRPYSPRLLPKPLRGKTRRDNPHRLGHLRVGHLRVGHWLLPAPK